MVKTNRTGFEKPKGKPTKRKISISINGGDLDPGYVYIVEYYAYAERSTETKTTSIRRGVYTNNPESIERFKKDVIRSCRLTSDSDVEIKKIVSKSKRHGIAE